VSSIRAQKFSHIGQLSIHFLGDLLGANEPTQNHDLIFCDNFADAAERFEILYGRSVTRRVYRPDIIGDLLREEFGVIYTTLAKSTRSNINRATGLILLSSAQLREPTGISTLQQDAGTFLSRCYTDVYPKSLLI
jgi:hypothetical protein